MPSTHLEGPTPARLRGRCRRPSHLEGRSWATHQELSARYQEMAFQPPPRRRRHQGLIPRHQPTEPSPRGHAADLGSLRQIQGPAGRRPAATLWSSGTQTQLLLLCLGTTHANQCQLLLEVG